MVIQVFVNCILVYHVTLRKVDHQYQLFKLDEAGAPLWGKLNKSRVSLPLSFLFIAINIHSFEIKTVIEDEKSCFLCCFKARIIVNYIRIMEKELCQAFEPNGIYYG